VRQSEAFTNYYIAALILLVIFLMGGGVYDIIENPPAFLQGAGGSYITIHPYLGEQTINESIVSMAMIGVSFLGLLIINRSTRILYDRSRANTQMLIGIGLAMLGFAGCYIIFLAKG